MISFRVNVFFCIYSFILNQNLKILKSVIDQNFLISGPQKAHMSNSTGEIFTKIGPNV